MADTQESIKNYSERVYAQELRLPVIDGKTTQVIRKSGVTETTVAIEGEDDVQFTGQVLNDFVYGKDGVEIEHKSQELTLVDEYNIHADRITYADSKTKHRLLQAVEDAQTEAQLNTAVRAITDSYNSTENNIGRSIYEQAAKVAAAKRASLLMGASDENQAGNGSNVEGNAYDVRDADSHGDDTSLDIVTGSNGFNSEGIEGTVDLPSNSYNGNNGTDSGTGTGGSGEGELGSDVFPSNSTQIGKVSGRASGYFDEDYDTVSTNVQTDTTASEAIAYANAISKEHEINHIFHNDFYSVNALPYWSFAVEFIPCYKSDNDYASFVTTSDLKILSEALFKINAAEREVHTNKLFYLGMSHPFFTKMPHSHGDLNITFAEDEEYSVTHILIKLLKWASYMPSFPTNELVMSPSVGKLRHNLLNNIETQLTKAPTDTESPIYRLNAPESVEKLPYKNKYVFDVILKLYKPADVHLFGDVDKYPQYIYKYNKCWLKNIDALTLNYDDDSPIDRSVTFSYQYLTTYTYYEYIRRTGLTTTVGTTTNTSSNVAENTEAYKNYQAMQAEMNRYRR